MEKLRGYRPAMAAFVLMMSMALTTTALSFFVVPVCQVLKLGRGEFTVYYSLMTASGTCAVPVLGQIVGRRGVRGILTVGSVWVAAGLTAFSLADRLWMFYAAGVCIGIFGTACVSLCANVIVQRAYSGARASGILGVVMAGSGVGGMLVSLVLPKVIGEFGWRWGYRAVALSWLILGLSALALLGKESITAQRAQQNPQEEGLTQNRKQLYVLIGLMFLLSAATGIQQQIPSVLTESGFDEGVVSAMVSFFTAMLALGKVGQGLLCGKVGAVRGGITVVGSFALGFAMLLVPGLTWPGLAALAIGMGSVTTVMPILTRNAFGTGSYAAVWSILSAVSNFGALIATPCFGLVYDAVGSYAPAMAGSALMLATVMASMFFCFRK